MTSDSASWPVIARRERPSPTSQTRTVWEPDSSPVSEAPRRPPPAAARAGGASPGERTRGSCHTFSGEVVCQSPACPAPAVGLLRRAERALRKTAGADVRVLVVEDEVRLAEALQ